MTAGAPARFRWKSTSPESWHPRPDQSLSDGGFGQRQIDVNAGARAGGGILRAVSRRDLTHLMTALADAAHAEADVGVRVAELDEAIGRGRADMRTPLNLASLEADGLVRKLADGTWALTDAGVQWLREDEALSDR
jgi:hypothetical protein